MCTIYLILATTRLEAYLLFSLSDTKSFDLVEIV
ncbi:hypothetical protein CASFOL_000434 [Castilleja foliolosa]|uniref:Uncharacterized protein n=1 Tax=Castilleja foliolosa TaxID=1961234 RepID=A0ABD3ENP6_9LAMI